MFGTQRHGDEANDADEKESTGGSRKRGHAVHSDKIPPECLHKYKPTAQESLSKSVRRRRAFSKET